MKSTRMRSAGFTLAEITVVIVIISILAALLLPAVLRGKGAAQITQTKQQIQSLSLALDSFYNDFGFYPSTRGAFNPATGGWGDDPSGMLVFGDYGYNEALVFCLTSKFTKGTGDEKSDFNLDPLVTPNAADRAAMLKRIQGTGRIVGRAPVNAGPYMEIKDKDLSDRDNDGWKEMNDAWGNLYLYVPKSDYLDGAGTGYIAGALVFRGVDPTLVALNADKYPDLTALTTDSLATTGKAALAEHQQRMKYQLISLGPDGWTPGVTNFRDITIVGNPYGGQVNPSLVGSDDDPSSPLGSKATPPRADTADDISNWK